MSVLVIPKGVSFFSMNSFQVDVVNKRMQPRQWSEAGFLKPGQCGRELSLLDQEALKKRGVTYTEIAAKLNELVHIREECITFSYFGNEIENNEYLFEEIVDISSQCCPFTFEKESDGQTFKDCGEGKGSWVVVVTRKATRETLFFSALHPHLIEEHGFFEDGLYRVDPDQVCDFFGLGKKQ